MYLEDDAMVGQIESKQTLILVGMHCANCAKKIEDEVNHLPVVSEAHLNLIQGKLTYECQESLSEEAKQALRRDIRKLILSHEPQITVIDPHGQQADQQSDVKPVPQSLKRRRNWVRFGVGALLLMVSFFLTMPYKLIFLGGAYLISGGDVLWRAIRNIGSRHFFDENFLMAVATLGALAIGEYAEAVAVMLFYQLGELFQAMAVDSSRRSIKELLDIRPDTAWLITGETPTQVHPDQIQPGHIIEVRPSERVPLDGKLLTGSTSLDMSALTGESLPVTREEGQTVLSGAINLSTSIRLQVTKDYQQSTAAKIMELIEESGQRKAKAESFIHRFATYYTPIVVLLAVLIAFLPPLILQTSLEVWVYRALVFLVISCPCALVISVPLSFFAGIGVASKKGILIKGGEYLEALNDVKMVVFDKTGTLTEGKLQVTQIKPVTGYSQDDLMEKVAYAEMQAHHPIAKSLVDAYVAKGQELLDNRVSHFQMMTGQGVEAVFDGQTIRVGKADFVGQPNRTLLENQLEIYVSCDGHYIGSVVLTDCLKKSSRQAIQRLRQVGLQKMVMLSGDKQAVAKEIAEVLELDDYYAELLPADKVSKVEELTVYYQEQATQSSKVKVAFVGDGLNDAPVIARADVGIAMGGIGSDATIEAADIVLMGDDLTQLAEGFAIARATRRIVVQNVSFALAVKLIVLMLGAFGLVSMWLAVFADVGVTLLAVLNAMRLLRLGNK